jgi:hypothetical protein
MDLRSGARMNRFVVVAVLVCAGVQGEARAKEPANGKLRLALGAESANIYDGEKPLAEYRSIESPRKPYVSKLFSPAGIQVLRDSPSDHKHHHALMFALSAAKVNFWEEGGPDAGTQKPVSNVQAWSQGGAAARAEGFVQDLEWIDPGSRSTLVTERRTIAALQGTGIYATLLLWRSQLQTAAGRSSVELGGAHYFGLGMRFVTTMDTGGVFFNSEGAAGEIVRGTERLTAARWAAYSAEAEGKPVTVALFDHPSNLRHPAKMFTMASPFAYLAATLNLWKEPWTLHSGMPLDLVYGVAVWDGRINPKLVDELYRIWLDFSRK